MDINLKDPKTKALYDSYGENDKESFEGGYLYMKHLHEFVALFRRDVFNMPPIPEMAKFDPDVLKRVKAKLDAFAQGWKGGSETSMYHSKVVRLESAKQLVTQKLDIKVEVPETVLPFKLARNVILKNPDSIAVGTCVCRMTNPNSSCMPEPMEACFILGDPHASFIAEHNSWFRKVTQEEAVNILEDCHKRGFVSTAWFKKDMGDRLFAICNCCACCCLGITMTNVFLDGNCPSTILAPSGYVSEIGEDCDACGKCLDKCQFHAIRLNEDKSRVEINLQRCRGCGVCEDQCPSKAITMRVEPSICGVFDLEELKKLNRTP